MHRLEAYITLTILFLFALSILFLPILWILQKKGKSIRKTLSYFGLFCSLFLILFATIFYMPISFHPDLYSINLTPFNWQSETQILVEFFPNILLFIPIGFFIPLVFEKKRKWYKTGILIFLLTFTIEFFQYFIGRSSDINDIISNTLGGMIGYSLFLLCYKVYKKRLCYIKK